MTGPEEEGDWQPAALPLGTEQGYIVAALYGELVSHPWRDPLDTSHPLFLFDHRSNDMGWTDRHESNSRWEVFEAGPEIEELEATQNPAPALWFYAGITLVPDGRSLPVWPFLRCAGDVAARVGTFDLHAVQLLLPVQKLHQQPGWKGFIPALQNYSWFIATDPGARAQVRVTLDSGQDPSIPTVAPEMLTLIQSVDQPVFVCDSLTDHDPLAPEFPFGDQFWRGRPRHQAVFSGSLAEWSVDALGWLAGFLADVAADLGVSTPLLFTATRVG